MLWATCQGRVLTYDHEPLEQAIQGEIATWIDDGFLADIGVHRDMKGPIMGEYHYVI